MTDTPRKNLPASVRQRLLNLGKARREPFDLLLVRYGIERLLYRFSRSGHTDRFLLKGAMLFHVWGTSAPRPTRDLDLLGFGPADGADLKAMFAGICELVVEPDGLEFLPASVRVAPVREDAAYSGIRVTLEARLDNARIPIQVDIGFGDAVTPAAETIDFPALLDFPAPRLKAYPIYTVVAEKVEAMVTLGSTNTRMKDFFDVWYLSQRFEFDGPVLVEAIGNTFARRQTTLPAEVPTALTEEFAAHRTTHWDVFLRKNTMPPMKFDSVIAAVREFLMPALDAGGEAKRGKKWNPEQGWH